MTLKDMRLAARLTQAAVAGAIPGAKQSLISQWESGECCPQLLKIPILAKLYGVTSDDIINACEAAKEQRQPRAG